MPGNAVSPAAQQLIIEHIHSIEQLEILLALGTNPGQFWSARDIFRVVQSNENSIAQCLISFSAAGLVIATPEKTYRLAENPVLLEIVPELAKAYRERHVTIIEMIYKKPERQVQNFAEAFKLRKEK